MTARSPKVSIDAGPAEERPEAESPAPWLALVLEKVGSLQYGSVHIVVHDSQVVQVERTERYRFELHSRP